MTLHPKPGRAPAAAHGGAGISVAQRIRQAIAEWPELSAEEWLWKWLARLGDLPPPLLEVAALLPAHVVDARDALPPHLQALSNLPAPHDPETLQPMPWAEDPHRQVMRVVNALFAGMDVPVHERPASLGAGPHTAVLTEAARQHLAQSMEVAYEWLRRASNAGSTPDTATGASPWNRWLPPSTIDAYCRLPLALVDLDRQCGVPAELHLQLVPHPGARLCLAPAPASALLLRAGAEWDETLALLRDRLLMLLRHDTGLNLHDTAIAWNLHRPDGQPLTVLTGPSAGASLALGAMWLLRDAAPPDWARQLWRLDADHLATAAFTAALKRDLELDVVGGLWFKAQALQSLASALRQHAGRQLELGVSSRQPLPAAEPGAHHVPIRPHVNLFTAVQHLAAQADRLSTPQEDLLRQLTEPGDRPPAVDLATLKAVSDTPANTLRQYLLRCWATCGLAMKGQLHLLYVPLQVLPDAMGRHQPLLMDGTGQFTTLQSVVARHDGPSLHRAYLVRGLPGSGKSTLLRHHLQHAARRLLQHLAGTWQPSADDPEPPSEVPVYLALGALPEDVPEVGLPDWLAGQIGQAGPAALRQLLAGQGDWAQRGLRARLLLDGLNELRVPRLHLRPERARQVVAAALQLLQRPLPLLLSIRLQHDADLGGMPTLRVDVQPWQRKDVLEYLKRRFPGDAQGHLKTLEGVEGALDLCRRPMHLAAQCDLLDAGFTSPPGNRAALYQAWLWQRLRRALGCDRDAADPWVPDPVWTEPADTFDPDALLLTDADRAAIRDDDAWVRGTLRPLPRQGQLLRSLMRQALDQWYAEADGGVAAAERTAGPVPWEQVAPWLPDDPKAAADRSLRRRFGRAVRDLGLVSLDDAYTTWAFDHQSWGEYLASCVLLDHGPPADERLLRRLRSPPLPFDTDEEEIASLGQSAAVAWNAVPAEVWADLAHEGLFVERTAFINGHYDKPTHDPTELERRWAALQADSRLAVFFDNGTWTSVQRDGREGVVADLRQWGDTTGLGETLGLGREGWRDQARAGGAGWQLLAQRWLTPTFQAALWTWLRSRLAPDLVAALQREQGRLEKPPLPDGAEVLGLALLGLSEPRLLTWLQALLAADEPPPPRRRAPPGAGPLWPAYAGVLPALQTRLEPDGAWGEQARGRPPRSPNPVLQHLRRVLLLASVDAGAACLPGVRASGTLALLDAQMPGQLAAALQATWQRWRRAAFRGDGQRLRRRLQAALALGWLGDNLRYRFRRVTLPGGQPREGLVPDATLWACVGSIGQASDFEIGSTRLASETPRWTARLPGFLACRHPLTVGEWRWFSRSPEAGPFGWARGDDPDFHNPLQPVTAITWQAMTAYAAWAAPLVQGDPADPYRGLGPALPTELQWEALAGSEADGQAVPQATAFNHASTRWARPSPVACFARSHTALGLADVRGNVWEFCASALTDEQRRRGWHADDDRRQAGMPAAADDRRERALRGGSFDGTASQCRPAYRSRVRPDYHGVSIGVRLVRVWPPNSEP